MYSSRPDEAISLVFAIYHEIASGFALAMT